MILSGVVLCQDPAHAGTVRPNQNEKVFNDESVSSSKLVHDLNMSQALSICADLILTFDY